jgi:hypothetical protein
MNNEDVQTEELSAAEEKVVKVELTVNELNVVLGALQELPHRMVDGLLKKLLEQGQRQLQQ